MTKEEAVIILDGFKSNPLFNEQHKQALEMAISALSDYDKMQKISLDLAFENDELMNKSRWIPVSERLPEKEGRYLCTVGAEHRKVREMYYAPQPWADKNKKVTWRSIDGAYVYDWFIEAWQPLPAPYKAERNEE